MIILAKFDKSLEMLDNIFPILMITATITFIMFCIISMLYLLPLYQKKVNLKASEDQKEEVRNLVEDVNYFAHNKKYQIALEHQQKDLMEAAARLKSINAQIDDALVKKERVKRSNRELRYSVYFSIHIYRVYHNSY